MASVEPVADMIAEDARAALEADVAFVAALLSTGLLARERRDQTFEPESCNAAPIWSVCA